MKQQVEAIVVKDTPQSFFDKVEKLVWEKDLNYLDATIYVIEKSGYEPEYVSKLVNSQLKAKLMEEAQKLNLLKTDFTRFF